MQTNANNNQTPIRGNPTQETQERIINFIQSSVSPMSLTAIALETGTSIYAVKQSVAFYERLGLVKTITSTGNVTFVFATKKSDNGKPTITN